MFQLKPFLKCATTRRGQLSTVYEPEYFGPKEDYSTFIDLTSFPFKEAYLHYWDALQRHSSNKAFKIHKFKKILNKYLKHEKTAENILKSAAGECTILSALRDLASDFDKNNELTAMQNFWFYQLSDYFIAKLISDNAEQYPRLQQMVSRKIFGDKKRLLALKKIMRAWNKRGSISYLNKCLKKEYGKSLNFVKRSIENITDFVKLIVGNKTYTSKRDANIQRTAALLNMSCNILEAGIPSGVIKMEMEKIEKPHKAIKDKQKKKTEDELHFVMRGRPKFNEYHALRSICLHHFLSKTNRLPKEKQKRFKKFGMSEMIGHSTEMNTAYFTKFSLEQSSGLKEEIIPYAKLKYALRKENVALEMLKHTYSLFLRDMQNVFSDFSDEFSTRKDFLLALFAEDSRKGKIRFPSFSNKPAVPSTSVMSQGSSLNEDEVQDEETTNVDAPKISSIKQSVKHQYLYTKPSVEKASYIISRVLKGVLTNNFLSVEKTRIDQYESESEYSYASDASEGVGQLGAFLKLLSLIGEKKSKHKSLHTLKHLEEFAKRLNNKLQDHHAVSSLCNVFPAPVNDLKNQESDASVTTGSSISNAGKKLNPNEIGIIGVSTPLTILALLSLFLLITEKIVSVRRALGKCTENRYHSAKVNDKDKTKDYVKSKSQRDKGINLTHLRDFLKFNDDLKNIDLYISIAQKYCPEYDIYENKPAIEKSDSSDFFANYTKETEKMKFPSDMDLSGKAKPQIASDSKQTSSFVANEADDWYGLEEDQSYMSWKQIPCQRSVKEPRLLYVKEDAAWKPFPDLTEEGAELDAEDSLFELPTTSNIPRIVTPFKENLKHKIFSKYFLLDPSPGQARWSDSSKKEMEKPLQMLNKLDLGLEEIKRNFQIFWITSSKKQLNRNDFQKIMFASWCGDNHGQYDEASDYFDILVKAIEEFDKLYRNRAADVTDLSQVKYEWLAGEDRPDHVSTVDMLGLKVWRNRLKEMYTEPMGSEGSSNTRLSGSSQASGASTKVGAQRPSIASAVGMTSEREHEKREEASGFPIRDRRSLREVMATFQSRSTHFRAPRLLLFGKAYRPITPLYLQYLNEECGFVDTEKKRKTHPNARFAPPKAIFYNKKEKQFYYHSNNFIDDFQRKYPGRFMKMPYHVKNEYGSMKHICTFISPRRLSWHQMSNWKGIQRNVSNKVDCVPFENTDRPPKVSSSGYTTLERRRGDPLEVSSLLVGFLISAGYDAYVVAGTSTLHRALYANTDDVTIDQNDLEPPSTNRYVQYNLLPPFSSKFLKASKAATQPVNFEDMKIFGVKQKIKELERQMLLKENLSEKKLIAEYIKKIQKIMEAEIGKKIETMDLKLTKDDVSEKSRETARKGSRRPPKKNPIDVLYEELVLELATRTPQEKSESRATIYLHEPDEPLESKYVKFRADQFRKSRRKKRKEIHHNEPTVEEIENEEITDHLEWLYGLNGPISEYSQLLKREKEQEEREIFYPTVSLLSFLESYEPSNNELEILAGQQLHNYPRETIRCRKKYNAKYGRILKKEKFIISRLHVLNFIQRITSSEKAAKNTVKDGETKNFEKKVSEASITLSKPNLLKSPLLKKLIPKVELYLPNRQAYDAVKGNIQNELRKLSLEEEKEKEEQQESDEERSSLVTPKKKIKEKEFKLVRSNVKKWKESKMLSRKAFMPSRFHCWVLVRRRENEVEEPFFIDVLTGCAYPTSDENYLKISCVWNDKNYYIPRYVATNHKETRQFCFQDNKCWFHLLPMEPFSEMQEKKKLPWWWESKGHPHPLQHIRMPGPWGRRPRISPLDWDRRFLNCSKKTFLYKKAAVEVYNADARPADGLVKRVTLFFDMKRTLIREVTTTYSMRKDRMIWRYFDINSGFVEERFEEGRPDNLKVCRYLGYLKPGMYTPKEFEFYGKWRKDKLKNILVNKKYLQAEFHKGRIDHLKRIKINYSLEKTTDRIIVWDEKACAIKRIRARYSRMSNEYLKWKDSFPDDFCHIPLKLDLNLAQKYSEYWFWDDDINSEIKWKNFHVNEDLQHLLKIKGKNPFIISEPILYGIASSFEVNSFKYKQKNDMFKKREKSDFVVLGKLAKEMEDVIIDTLLTREYEKVHDVLRVSKDIFDMNLQSEERLISLKRHFQAERENLLSSENFTSNKKDIWDLWKNDESTLAGKFLNYTLQERCWLYFVLAGWEDINSIFRHILKEKEESTLLSLGMKDLLGIILDALNQGFRFTQATFPLVKKRNVNLWETQISQPIRYGMKRIQDLGVKLRRTLSLHQSSFRKDAPHKEGKSRDVKHTAIISGLGEHSNVQNQPVRSSEASQYTKIKLLGSLNKLFHQVSLILNPVRSKRIAKKDNILYLWNNSFIELYNQLLNRFLQDGKESLSGQKIIEVIDQKHPVGKHLKLFDKQLEIIKNQKVAQKLSEDEIDAVIRLHEKGEGVKQADVLKVQEILSKKEQLTKDMKEILTSLIQEASSNLMHKSFGPKISFDESHQTKFALDVKGNQDGYKDQFTLFLKNYEQMSNSSKTLRKFLNQLQYKPGVYVFANRFVDGRLDTSHFFKYGLLKSSVIVPKIYKKASKGSSCDKGSIKSRRHEDASQYFLPGTRLLQCDFKNKIGVADIINLFAEPYESHSTSSQQLFRSFAVNEENEITVFDSRMHDHLLKVFPLDYPTLYLYSQEIPEDLLENVNNKRTIPSVENEKQVTMKVDHSTSIYLSDIIKSCPHCINVYYEANNERMYLVQMIKHLRDEMYAAIIANASNSDASEFIEAYKKRYKLFSDYVFFLEDKSSIWKSLRNRITCDEWGNMKFFFERLNLKAVKNYAKSDQLFRQMFTKHENISVIPVNYDLNKQGKYEALVN